MIKCILIIFLLSITCYLTDAQYSHSTIDTVISYHWGEGQNGGQSSEYFPQNIFGKPDSAARSSFQSSDPNEICSLGLGGEIIVSFKDFEIVDGPGPDFTIFENAFINPVTHKVFAEPGMVSVSEDGITFYDFPFDSATLIGCAGITPTNGDNDCFNPDVSGGDKFDIGKLGLSRVRYIKIIDITKMVLDNPKHYYYDPILSGFDLDAVAGLNLEPIHVASVYETEYRILQNDKTIEFINFPNNCLLNIYTLEGQFIKQYNFDNHLSINPEITGVYFLIIFSNGKVIVRKVLMI